MSCSGHVDHAEAELDRGRILTENDEVDGGVQHACLAAEHALKAALASEGEPVPTGSKGHDLSFLASQASMDVPFETVLLTLDGAYNRAALSGHTAPRHHRSGLDTERRRIAHRVHHGEHEPMSEHTIRLAAIRDHLEAVIEDAGIAAELGVVFGSRIRGTATEASDTDVLLVSDDFVGFPAIVAPRRSSNAGSTLVTARSTCSAIHPRSTASSANETNGRYPIGRSRKVSSSSAIQTNTRSITDEQ